MEVTAGGTQASVVPHRDDNPRWCYLTPEGGAAFPSLTYWQLEHHVTVTTVLKAIMNAALAFYGATSRDSIKEYQF